MLMGFISLLLAVAQTPIPKICIPAKAGSVMLPCKPKGGGKSGGGDGHRRLLWYPGEEVNHRRFLAGGGAGDDFCDTKVRPALQSNKLPRAMMMMMEVMKSITFLLLLVIRRARCH
jgi:mlo protein